MKGKPVRPARRRPARTTLQWKFQQVEIKLSSVLRDVELAAVPATAPPAVPARRKPAPSTRRRKPSILFVGANPLVDRPLRVDAGLAAAQREIKQSAFRNDFRFEARLAITIADLMRHLTELDPTILHVSGHGAGTAGLLLEDELGQPRLITAHAFALLIENTTTRLRVVVLNACYSIVQAEALRDLVDAVIGMDGAIDDVAARVFTARFYGALASRRSVGNAFAQAVAALAAHQLPDEHLPRLLTRAGIDADRLYVAHIT